MEEVKRTRQLVTKLVEGDIDALEAVVTARRAARPPGARHLSEAEVIRQLIREACRPGDMTDDECSR